MKHCVLHFGMHKTGSSSIQESLYYTQALTGARYVRLGHPNASGPLMLAFRESGLRNLERRQGRARVPFDERKDKVLRALDSELAQDSERFILSAESLAHMLLPELEALIEALATRVDRITAVGYVRPAQGYMESALQQHVRTGHTGKWHPGRFYPDYRKHLEKFEQALGRENVQFWLFEPSSFPDRDVVKDFCSRLGLGLPESSIRRVNESMSADALKLMWVFRKHGLPLVEDKRNIAKNRALVERLSLLKGPKISYAPELVEAVLEEHREDLDWMASRVGGSLARMAAPGSAMIHDELDLESCSSDALNWLAQQLGDPPVRAQASPGARQLAVRVFRLWSMLGSDAGEPADGPNLSREQAREAMADAMHEARAMRSEARKAAAERRRAAEAVSLS